TPPGHRDDALDRLTEPPGIEAEMAGFAALSRGQHDAAALAHRGGAEQIIQIGYAGAHVSRRRPLVRRNCAALGTRLGVKYPAAFFAAISTWASSGTRRSGKASRSTISTPAARS